MIRPLICILAALFWIETASAQPSSQAVTDAFLAGLADAGFVGLTAGGVQQDGNVTIVPALTGERRSDGARLSIAAVSIVGAQIDPEGVLSADGVRFDQVSLGLVLSVPVAVFENVRFRRGRGASLVPDFAIAAADGVRAQSESGAGLSVAALRFAQTRSAPAGGITVAGRIDGLVLDPALWPPSTAKRLRSLELSSLAISVDGAGHWNPLAGTATIDALTVSIANAGTLSLSTSARGLTANAIKVVSRPEATFTERLSAIVDVVLERFSLSFIDDGITGRLLGVAAAERGLSRDALAAQLAAAIPTRPAVPQGTAWAAQLATFLASPGTLSLTASDGKDIPLLELVTALLLNPAELAALLTPSATVTP